MKEFRVQYSSGHPPRADQPRNNTYGLTGEGKVVVDAGVLTFEGTRTGMAFGGAPKLAIADMVNVDYSADKNAFLIHARDGKHYIILWLTSREDAKTYGFIGVFDPTDGRLPAFEKWVSSRIHASGSSSRESSAPDSGSMIRRVGTVRSSTR